jgi:L-cysteine desulfidase
VPLEEILFLQKALDLNYRLAMEGLDQDLGACFGQAWAKLKGDPVYLKAKSMTAAASDARMAGKNLSAMSCASSGNVGITASLPLLAVAQGYEKEGEPLLRALALSFLLTIYIKSHIGRLSAMCACAIAAGLGVTAGTVVIMGGNLKQIEGAIQNVVGSIGGIICDGAKMGCALKLSTAAGVAIEAAQLAIQGISIPAGDGLVADTADETIADLGRVATEGMIETDLSVCKIIIGRKNNYQPI